MNLVSSTIPQIDFCNKKKIVKPVELLPSSLLVFWWCCVIISRSYENRSITFWWRSGFHTAGLKFCFGFAFSGGQCNKRHKGYSFCCCCCLFLLYSTNQQQNEQTNWFRRTIFTCSEIKLVALHTTSSISATHERVRKRLINWWSPVLLSSSIRRLWNLE